MRRKLAAGNWKMNGTAAALDELAALAEATREARAEVLICPPATLLSRAADRLSASHVTLGGQDCHAATSGAHTGDVSAEMLRDAGASAVILGHSERRADHGETDAEVRAKAEAAIAAGLTAVICVGETLEERENGKTLDVVRSQLDGSLPDGSTGDTVVVAYEPVWAIGTGRTATPEQVADTHRAIRQFLENCETGAGQSVRIVYGGSVKAANAAALFSSPEVDGGLIGGASLQADEFSNIGAALANTVNPVTSTLT